MDCIYTSSKKGITIKYTSPCFDQKYQIFIDSFLNKLLTKINRIDSINEILVLVNYEQLYYDNDSEFSNFISLGFDTLREINSDYITRYFYKHYNTSEESRLDPVNINFTDRRESTKKGIKIVYNYDYRLGSPIWSDIEKLIIFSELNLQTIKETQKADTVRHYSCFVTLPKLDSLAINKILGKEEVKVEQQMESKKNVSSFWLLSVIGLTLCLVVTKLIKKQSS